MKIFNKNVTARSIYLKSASLLGRKHKPHLVDKTIYGPGLEVFKEPISKILTKDSNIRSDIYHAKNAVLCNQSGIAFGNSYILDKNQYSYHTPNINKIKSTAFEIQEECISFVGPFMENYCHFLTHILLNAPLVNQSFSGLTILLPGNLKQISFVNEAIPLYFPNSPVIYLDQPVFVNSLYKIEVDIGGQSISSLREFISLNHWDKLKKYDYENIFVGRNAALRRICINQRSIENVLGDNFHSVDCANLSFLDQFSTFYNAKRVIGIHGAALTNIIFCKNLEYFHEFKDPRDDDLIFKAISMYSLGSEYRASYGKAVNDKEFIVNMSDVHGLEGIL